MKKIALKKLTLDTLRDNKINRINFRYGSLNVYPHHFRGASRT